MVARIHTQPLADRGTFTSSLGSQRWNLAATPVDSGTSRGDHESPRDEIRTSVLVPSCGLAGPLEDLARGGSAGTLDEQSDTRTW
jgi:hypothetical protein